MSTKKEWDEVLGAAGDNAKQHTGLKRTFKGRVPSQTGSDHPEEQTNITPRDPSKKGKFIESPRTVVIRGSAGAYERYIGTGAEPARANPDILGEADAMYSGSQPSTPQLLMGEAITHLQGRQKEAYLLTMREGKSFSEAAEVLGVSKSAIQGYMTRAAKFITQYCKNAIANGRV